MSMFRRKSKDVDDGKGSPRFSMINAKKKVASKVGETKVGRTTLIKVLGDQADDIVSALKETTIQYENRETAKALKKDIFKWVLKGSVLYQNKKLSADNAGHLRRPMQLFAERLVWVSEKYPCGQRNVSHLVNELQVIGSMLCDVLGNLSQEKNVDKLKNLVDYYGNFDFINALLNDPAYDTFLNRIITNIKSVLEPFPSMFDDEKSAMDALERAEICFQAMQEELSTFMGDYPTLSGVFDKFIREYDGGKFYMIYQLCQSTKSYKGLNSRSIRITRGSQLVDKIVAAAEQGNLNQDLVTQFREHGVDGRVNMFDEVQSELESVLETIFKEVFVQTAEYKEFREKYAAEFTDLKERFGNTWSNRLKVSTPSCGNSQQEEKL